MILRSYRTKSDSIDFTNFLENVFISKYRFFYEDSLRVGDVSFSKRSVFRRESISRNYMEIGESRSLSSILPDLRFCIIRQPRVYGVSVGHNLGYLFSALVAHYPEIHSLLYARVARGDGETRLSEAIRSWVNWFEFHR